MWRVSEGWAEAQDGAGAHHRTVLPCKGLDIFPNKELGSAVGRRGGASPLRRVLAIGVLARRTQLAVPW